MKKISNSLFGLVKIAFVVVVCQGVLEPGMAADAVDGAVVRRGRVDADVLSVRARPGTNYEVIAKVRRGDEVSIFSERGEWLEIAAPAGSKAWCAAEYVGDDGVVTGDQVWVRAGPGLVFSPYSTLDKGMKVATVGEPKNGWVQIAVPVHATAWVHGDYVLIVKEEDTAVVKAVNPKMVVKLRDAKTAADSAEIEIVEAKVSDHAADAAGEAVVETVAVDATVARDAAKDATTQLVLPEIQEDEQPAAEAEQLVLPVIEEEEEKTTADDDDYEVETAAAELTVLPSIEAEVDNAVVKSENEIDEVLELKATGDEVAPDVVIASEEFDQSETTMATAGVVVVTDGVGEAELPNTIWYDLNDATGAMKRAAVVAEVQDAAQEGAEQGGLDEGKESFVFSTADATAIVADAEPGEKQVIETRFAADDEAMNAGKGESPMADVAAEVEPLLTAGTLVSLGNRANAYATHVIADVRNGAVLPKCYLISTRINLREWEWRKVRVYGKELWYPGWTRPTIRVDGVQLLDILGTRQ